VLETGTSSADLYAAASRLDAGTERDELLSIADSLRPVEQEIYSDAIVRALSSGLGYETRIETGEFFTAIEAVKDHETMIVLVDGPDVITDQIGLSGTTCVRKQEEFQQALAKEGVMMDLNLKKHLDPRGGEYADVFKSAGRMHAGSLAKGIVECVKQDPGMNPLQKKGPFVKRQVPGTRKVLV